MAEHPTQSSTGGDRSSIAAAVAYVVGRQDAAADDVFEEFSNQAHLQQLTMRELAEAILEERAASAAASST